ncbi:hypothetical protein [Rickettsia massiliae]|uniref:hypothetical protein n=1 Tax=Rickettsia massiliae TaxID=35791 RepID=UPI0002E00CAC|nr:hypothetical protein [Rickettsia massiliae]
MEFNRKNTIIGFLKAHEDQKFTSCGIAEWLVENHIDEARLKANASTNKRLLEAKTQEEKDKEIIGIDVGEISSSKLSAERRQEPNRIELKPKLKFYYSQNPDYYVNNEQATEPKINANKEDKIIAVQICDALALYLQNKLKIHNIPIKHNCSSNKQGTKKGNNKWLHPDWVGMGQFLMTSGVH